MNLLGKEWVMADGSLSRYTLRALNYQQISGEHYLAYIIMLRMKTVIILLLLAKALPKHLVAIGSFCLAAFTLGSLVTLAVFANGLMGCALILAALFPHGIFYFLAFYLWVKSIWEGSKSLQYIKDANRLAVRKESWFLYAICMLLILLGCLTESYLNPVVFQKVINL